MRERGLPILLSIVISVLIIFGLVYYESHKNGPGGVVDPAFAPPAGISTPMPHSTDSGLPAVSPSASPVATVSPAPSGSPSPIAAVDLSVDVNGLSKATVIMVTTQGVIKFKFYPQDAPNTVNRIVELIQKGFYNGLLFHRVIPGFVIQGGDPAGNGNGGSGQKLKAEFNNRRHIEGTVAMARASDPDSADSQFYISLGVNTHLDHNYTVFGQVIEGMDVAKRIKVGDKMTSVTIE